MKVFLIWLARFGIVCTKALAASPGSHRCESLGGDHIETMFPLIPQGTFVLAWSTMQPKAERFASATLAQRARCHQRVYGMGISCSQEAVRHSLLRVCGGKTTMFHEYQI